LFSPGAAFAQSYPKQTGAWSLARGRRPDAIARISDKLSTSLGKQFYVVNQPGAGGTSRRVRGAAQGRVR
jgi:tripartite-type tricarboxylate transporter receptor subunit TctC